MPKSLIMTFLNEQNKNVSISIDDSREDITAEEIKTAMETIVAKNIFGSKGGNFVKVNGAKIVTTSITEFEYDN